MSVNPRELYNNKGDQEFDSSAVLDRVVIPVESEPELQQIVATIEPAPVPYGEVVQPMDLYDAAASATSEKPKTLTWQQRLAHWLGRRSVQNAVANTPAVIEQAQAEATLSGAAEEKAGSADADNTDAEDVPNHPELPLITKERFEQRRSQLHTVVDRVMDNLSVTTLRELNDGDIDPDEVDDQWEINELATEALESALEDLGVQDQREENAGRLAKLEDEAAEIKQRIAQLQIDAATERQEVEAALGAVSDRMVVMPAFWTNAEIALNGALSREEGIAWQIKSLQERSSSED